MAADGLDADPHVQGVVDVEEVEPGLAILVLAGEFDLSSEPGFRQAVDRCIAAGHHRLIVEVSAVDFIDSTMLQALFTAAKRVRALPGGALVLAGAGHEVRRLFEITAIHHTLPVFPARGPALDALRSRP